MRKAAGIILIMFGVALAFYLGGLSLLLDIGHGVRGSDLSRDASMTISGAILLAGGYFCLKVRYWRVCFASALLLLLIMIYFMVVWMQWGFVENYRDTIDLLIVILWGIGGTLPIIFVCLRKREWQQSWASPGFSMSV